MPELRVLLVDVPSKGRRQLRAALGALPGVAADTAASVDLASMKLAAGDVDFVLLAAALAGAVPFAAELARRGPGFGWAIVDEAASGRPHVDAILAGARGTLRYPADGEPDESVALRLSKVLGLRASALPPRPGPVAFASAPVVAPDPSARRELVAIGCSTGGPLALARVLQSIGDCPLPVAVVQHMGADHVAFFAESLAKQVPLEVRLATDGEPLRAGCVHVAPGDRHLLVARAGTRLVARLDDGPPEHNCRPAVDPFLRSVAAACGDAAIGVVLTGMGSDGALGALAMATRGAPIVAQDRATSVVWGMPGAAVAAGAVTAGVRPLDEVGAEVRRWWR